MGKLRDHFDRDHDPDGYERVKCGVCNGTGLPRATSGAFWAFDACAPLTYCRTCHGKGYLLVKKES
jgi:hypothetical protein